MQDEIYSPLIAIKTSSRRGQSIFCCIPGAGASVTSFLDFASVVGAGTVLGMQARGLDGQLPPYETVEEAAEAYVSALLGEWPESDYYLVGHSFGGLVAFEMACLLVRRGKCLPPVVLLDPATPSLGHSTSIKELEAFLQFVQVVEESNEVNLMIQAAELERNTREERIRILHKKMISYGILPARSRPGSLAPVFDVFLKNLRTAYWPKDSYGGSVIHVRPVSIFRGVEEHELWRRCASNSCEIETPGTHMTMLRKENMISVFATLCERGWLRQK